MQGNISRALWPVRRNAISTCLGDCNWLMTAQTLLHFVVISRFNKHFSEQVTRATFTRQNNYLIF